MPEINKKEFLAKESINSTAAIHTKLRPDGIAQIRISDCNNSIKLWNNLNHTDEHAEMMEKIGNTQKTNPKFLSLRDPRWPPRDSGIEGCSISTFQASSSVAQNIASHRIE